MNAVTPQQLFGKRSLEFVIGLMVWIDKDRRG